MSIKSTIFGIHLPDVVFGTLSSNVLGPLLLSEMSLFNIILRDLGPY